MQHRSTVQIGRTHGQHALPITFGFWIATIMSRLLYNIEQADMYASGLVGKIAGAVGAYNAQKGLGIFEHHGVRFEDRVLDRLGLKPALISTQIVPPEPLAYYLYSMLMLSGAFGQFGRDGRNLMRTEIAELSEPFERGQVGSSTMAHKRNPLNFENIEGTFFKNVAEFLKVLMTVISEHQRDLVGSTISRDFPTIVINAVSQMDTLMRKNKAGVPFLSRVKVNVEACRRNAQSSGNTILAEPLYLMLQMNGYRGDAHKLVNEQAMEFVSPVCNLYMAIEMIAEDNPEVAAAWAAIPAEMRALFRNPEQYAGRAAEQTDEVCARVEDYLRLHS
jgi:adenylosuccinate lyase